ncbi:sugar phosphate nucleotidyltransferase [Bacillus pinisoli]|uniref:sugar phosphate nucleotidyltransferase n=1 Tax=Bacillus pinisoli TaxID=2901866 RepID=UPI001FF4AD78|nr:NDP-sugar synthase [Bacillus pinisoli]
MKAVVLAGGEGRRMRPLTATMPKPMIPLFQKPVLEYIIEFLSNQGIFEVFIMTHHQYPSIERYFQDGARWGVTISYIYESQSLGTAGCLKGIEAYINDDKPLFVINGDIITDIDLADSLEFHQKNKALLTVLTTYVDDPRPFGMIERGKDGRVKKIVEKPLYNEIYSHFVNMGMYIIQSELLQYIIKDQPYDMSRDLLPLLLRGKQPVYGYETTGYWADIGSVSQYKQTHIDVLEGKVNIPLSTKELYPGIIVGENVVVEEGVVIKGPVFIGDRTILKKGSVIGKNTIIGCDCVVTESAHIKHSIIWEHVYIGASCEILNSIIANNSIITNSVKVRTESVIGERCEIQSEISPRMLINPYSKR